MKRFVILVLLAAAFCSCAIKRHEVKQHQASFSSTGQDSGIVSTAKDNGFVVNSDWIAGYRSLLKKYGQTLTPPRTENDVDGITKIGNQYMVSDSVMERQLVLNQRRLNDETP